MFDIINFQFGPFTLDPCASAENAKCKKFFTKEQDGLKHSWAGERVWLNPPYGKELPLWAAKAVREMREYGTYSVFLIPPRVGTPWLQDLCKEADLVRFLRGRVAFNDPAGNRTSPMDDSCLVILDPASGDRAVQFSFWDWKADILRHLGEEAYRSVGGRK